MNFPWPLVMSLAWDAFRGGNLPIGAVVLDEHGTAVGQAHCARADAIGRPNQLAGSRIAHAEVNALAHLPFRGSFQQHSLYTNVERCCLCMGAALQTGVGAVHYGWRDHYGGAATSMVVHNPQLSRRRTAVVGPADGFVEKMTGLLATCHYFYRRPGGGARSVPWREERPDLVDLAARPAIAAAVRHSVARETTLDILADTLSSLAGWTF
ncbi:CMP/dCMP-type deaminase domain-containing protein [Frankia sp. AiPs1]|uniref:deaminase n=1 Tax=Frankia sp. AiPa1 TaxID=573492 RepID=UPI00202B98E4|nr:deaminase [Frankia sp. AiPa1]MCL9761077.1 deaminase [Frankia sp. AiPa1]